MADPGDTSENTGASKNLILPLMKSEHVNTETHSSFILHLSQRWVTYSTKGRVAARFCSNQSRTNSLTNPLSEYLSVD